MASVEQLTARCAACRNPVFPRVHPCRRDAFCIGCQVPSNQWSNDLGLSLPNFIPATEKKLSEAPCVGDLILAAMTGRAYGTRAWLGAMLGDALIEEADHEYPAALLLTDLEQLGHIEQSPDKRRWWLRPSRWIRDRAHRVNNGHAELAVGARDSRFWQNVPHHIRVCQTRDDRPSMVVRAGPGEDDWTLNLARDLRPLREWILDAVQVDVPDDRPLKRLTLQGERVDERPDATDIATWRHNGRDVYAAPAPRGHRVVSRGVARILAAKGLPYARNGLRFAIPRDFQPPMPYRRVLTLCSGLLPTESKDATGNAWHVFDGVGDDIFDALQMTLPLREIK